MGKNPLTMFSVSIRIEWVKTEGQEKYPPTLRIRIYRNTEYGTDLVFDGELPVAGHPKYVNMEVEP